MIRINFANLLPKKVNPQDQAAISSTPDLGFGDVEASGEDLKFIRREALKNLMLILLGSISLIVYEQMHIPELRQKLNIINNELNALMEKNSKARQAVEQSKKLIKEQANLQSQISSIENLKKDRALILKIFELFQKNTPSTIWLNEINFGSDRVLLSGQAISDADVTTFMDALSRSVYFKEVNLVRSIEHQNNKFGLVKKIEINCVIESNL